jgi:hypothetical protein
MPIGLDASSAGDEPRTTFGDLSCLIDASVARSVWLVLYRIHMAYYNFVHFQGKAMKD